MSTDSVPVKESPGEGGYGPVVHHAAGVQVGTGNTQYNITYERVTETFAQLEHSRVTPSVLCTLPADTAFFTGRRAEMARFLGKQPGGGRPSGVIGIHAVDGMAGVGKTAFAVHAAHQLAPQYPDGQFFLCLHAHAAGRPAADPSDVVAALLLATGTPAQQIPAGLDERAALWRDWMARRRILLVLDDAAGSDQVLPLLPGTGQSLVLVTSRRRLAALPEARCLSLETLPPHESARLFTRLAGRPYSRKNQAEVLEIAALCGDLPLAISLVAGQLKHHPAWSVADQAAGLASARDRLALIRAESASVSAAFDLSYRGLAADQSRMFRRLGLHPGTDIDPWAAAALDGGDASTAAGLLDDLFGYHLVQEPARGRYRLHDLMREHARAQVAADPTAECDAAVDRLLEYYLHCAHAAGRHLARRSPPGLADSIGTPPVPLPDLQAREQAVSWLAAERVNLHAAVDCAAALGRRRHVIAMPLAMHGFLRTYGHWSQDVTLHDAALTAARDAGDALAEANICNYLGDVHQLAGDLGTASANHTRARDLYHQLGEHRGEAYALGYLGIVQHLAGEYRAAIASQEGALAIYGALGDQHGEAHTLNSLGDLQQATSDYPAAIASQERALEIYRTVGDRTGEAYAENYLGMVHRLTGNYPSAAASQERALRLYRELGEKLGEANAVNDLGLVQELTGQYPAAAASQERALKLYRDIGSRLGEAYAYKDLASLYKATGNYTAAASGLATALDLYRQLGDPFGEAETLNILGALQQLTGDHASAAASQEQALRLYRQLGDRNGEAKALNELGATALATSRTGLAQQHHTQALTIASAIGAPQERARALEGIGTCQTQDGQHAEGRQLLNEALALYQSLRSPHAGRLAAALHGQS